MHFFGLISFILSKPHSAVENVLTITDEITHVIQMVIDQMTLITVDYKFDPGSLAKFLVLS